MSYMHLAKTHHPDYGGDVEQFRIINEAYRNMKKQYHIGKMLREVQLVTEPVLSDIFILGHDSEENENWINKRDKISALFATHAIHSQGTGQAGRDEFADFELRLLQAPHLTDGFISFYCLYLQSISHSIKSRGSSRH